MALSSHPLDRLHVSGDSRLGGPGIPRGYRGNLESHTHPTGGQAWVVGSWIRWGLHPGPADPQLPTWATVLAQAWGPPNLTKRRTREARGVPSPGQEEEKGPALGQLLKSRCHRDPRELVV